MRTLRKGMTGSDVLRWQLFLIEQGFLAGTADGSFGELTLAATIEFQRRNDLRPDGIVGRQTLGLAPQVLSEDESVTSEQSPLTEAALRQIMPGLTSAKCSTCLPFLRSAMTEFAIHSPARAAAFLAQLAHESGQLRFMEEIWGPTADQIKYEPVTKKATRLGNRQPGDGKRFKGRGPIQLTGRTNYGNFGDALGIDLISSPDLAATPEVGFRIAGLYWKENGLNELADQLQFETITKRINGGFNGLEDRKKFFERAKRVLGVAALRGLPKREEEERSVRPRFSRGLDDPGEVTPTAAERNPGRRTGTRPTRKSGGKPGPSRRGRKTGGRTRTRKVTGKKATGAVRAKQARGRKGAVGRAATAKTRRRKGIGKRSGKGRTKK